MNVRQNVALALVAGSLLMVAGTAGAAAKVEEATSRSPGSAARSAPAAARGAGARGAAADDTPSGPMTPSETLGPASKGNAAAKQGKSAQGSESRRVHGVRREGLRGGNFCRQFVFAHGGNRVVVQAAVRLQANQRSLPLAEVVVNDEAGAVIKADVEVITFARGDEFFRRKAARLIRELVVRTAHGFYVRRCTAGAECVGGEGVAGGVFQGEGNAGHVGFPG